MAASYHPHIGLANDALPVGDIIPPEIYGDFELDDTMQKHFSALKSKVVSAKAYGRSLWGKCAKVTTTLRDGQEKIYFLKVALGPTALMMCYGEYESTLAIHAIVPSLTPAVYSWGKCTLEPDAYFLISDFRTITQQPPEPLKFTARLAELHHNSVSPTGKFGFHVTTPNGTTPQLTNAWHSSWAVFYHNLLEDMFKIDEQTHGFWPDHAGLATVILNKVIPRLLEPLQSEGRSIKPCLLHADIWDENTATDAVTGEPFLFDAGGFYGHNEYEVGNWGAKRHRLSRPEYIESYRRLFPVSEPVGDAAGRKLLYSLKFNTSGGVLIPGSTLRKKVLEDMETLVEEYCPEDWIAIKVAREKRDEAADDA